jgi:tetratricopeptide (TPR) repeat protein
VKLKLSLILVCAVIAAIAAPTIQFQLEKNRRRHQIGQLWSLIHLYYAPARNGSYPTELSELRQLPQYVPAFFDRALREIELTAPGIQQVVSPPDIVVLQERSPDRRGYRWVHPVSGAIEYRKNTSVPQAAELARAASLDMNANNFKEALAKLQRASQLRPDVVEYHVGMGMAAGKLRMRELAEIHLRAAESLLSAQAATDPKRVIDHAIVLALLGQTDEARKVFNAGPCSISTRRRPPQITRAFRFYFGEMGRRIRSDER